MSVSPELRLILATNTEGLPPELGTTGFVPMDHGAAIGFLEQAGVWFGPRRVLEEREDYRQIIPYIVLRIGDRIVRYTRTPAGGETRLHGRMSIGLGGHVDLVDSKASGDSFQLLGTVEQAAERELQEELGEVTCERRRWVGLLVDNETAVGRVHIGLIGIWDIGGLPDREAEDAVGEVELVSLSELQKNAGMLETWSAMLLPWLEGELAEVGRAELLT
ncbi:NUDIX domain-containing protein [Sphingomonas carotinifaciens]|uniref:NUDIX domain-containing protein n=1 Tax=Sphingomonas carotinifaciens TaxID=1166323 RepID=UPI00123727F6|nr:NUDIX domain-containing protein [Sphingomonas carotinifaciens]